MHIVQIRQNIETWIEMCYCIPMGILEDIIEYYNHCESIKETARNFGLSEQKIRKVLINADLYSSQQIKIAKDMYESGLSAEEIAEKLNVTKKCVQSYLPYSKGMYCTDNPTKNALRIRKYRKKIRKQENENK